MKKYLYGFLILLFTTCTSKSYKEKLLGLWIGSEDNNDKISYIQFLNDTVYRYQYFYSLFSPYSVNKEKIFLSNTESKTKSEKKIIIEYLIKNDSLFLNFDNQTDTFYRSKHINFLYEYLDQTNLEILIPKIKFDKTIENPIHCKPIFIGYKKNSDSIKIIAGTEQIDIESLSSKIKDFVEHTNEIDKHNMSISLYIDQNVDLKYIKNIIDTIGKSWISNARTLYFITDNESIFSSNKYGLKRNIPYVYKYNVIPDNELNELSNFSKITIDSIGSISINNQSLAQDEFRKFIKAKIVNNIDHPEFSSLVFDDKINYVEYMKFLKFIFSIRDTLRNSYAFQTYGKPYEKLNQEELYQTDEKVDFKFNDFVITYENYKK